MKIELDKATRALKEGGIILYPTDTIWGIGCDATNCKAISKIFNLKRRTESKALISLVSDKRQLRNITGYIPHIDITSKPTTIIYHKVSGLSKNLLASNGSAAIRIVKDEFCKRLIQNFGQAIVSTSANISGVDSPKQFSEISKEIKNNVDYIVNLRHDELMTNPSAVLMINKDGSVTNIR